LLNVFYYEAVSFKYITLKRKEQSHHDIIDLTSITNSSATDNRYICKECQPTEQLLIPYPQAQIENPFAGPSYICPSCSTVYDSSLVKLPRAAKPVKSTIGSEIDSMTDFVIETVEENRGLIVEDEYEKYNPDPLEDEWIKAQGGTIIDSRIELTDSSGMNRTIVKRASDNNVKTY